MEDWKCLFWREICWPAASWTAFLEAAEPNKKSGREIGANGDESGWGRGANGVEIRANAEKGRRRRKRERGVREGEGEGEDESEEKVRAEMKVRAR